MHAAPTDAIGLESSGWWISGDSSAMPDALAMLQTPAEREGVDVPTIGLALCWRIQHDGGVTGQFEFRAPDPGATALSVQLDRTDVYQIIQASMGEALP